MVVALAVSVAALVWARHHANIRRLLAGTDAAHRDQGLTHADLDRLRLARAESIGPITYRRLLQRYGSPAAALDAIPGLARAGGRAQPPAVPSRDAARRECDRLGKLGAALLFLDQPGYPPLLALLDDAPPALAVLGRPEALSARAVAVVGSRNASANGQRMTEALAHELAQAGLAVVSGMARGIDAAAHVGALAGGATIACVAGGLDQPYPPEHADLQARIAEGGARWWPRRRSAPRRRHGTFRAATASSPGCLWAWWWWRRHCAPAA